MRELRLACLLTIGLVVAATARAGTVAARMQVTATVAPNCQLTVPALSFGSYDPLIANATAPADAAAVVRVSCTRNTSASFSFDFGLHAVNDAGRMMAGAGGDRLHYEIYRDSSRSLVWGQGSEALRLISKAASVPQEFTVFGRIPAQQEVEPGAYNDVLTAAVDF